MTFQKLFLTTVPLILIIPLLSGCDGKCWPLCGSSSSGTTTEVVVADCSGLMNCEGTYSTASDTGAKWVGACVVNNVTQAGGYVKLHFDSPAANCGFRTIRASGDVGSKWKIYTDNYDVNDRKYMVKYLGTDVFDLLCLEGGVASKCAEE